MRNVKSKNAKGTHINGILPISQWLNTTLQYENFNKMPYGIKFLLTNGFFAMLKNIAAKIINKNAGNCTYPI